MQLALGLLHSQAMPTPTAAELAGFLEENPWQVRINSSFVSDAQDDSDVEIQGADFVFLVCPPK